MNYKSTPVNGASSSLVSQYSRHLRYNQEFFLKKSVTDMQKAVTNSVSGGF